LSLVGYCAFFDTGLPTGGVKKNCQPDFIHLPSSPIPVFRLVCKGCATTPDACKEYCKEFAQEKIGYRAWEWNSSKAEFEQLYITAEEYLPLKHGYFHYQIWKAGADNAKRNYREWRKQKAEPEKERPSKKSCTDQVTSVIYLSTPSPE
jgi:hypothetical protein